jgi:hypothetical protein
MEIFFHVVSMVEINPDQTKYFRLKKYEWKYGRFYGRARHGPGGGGRAGKQKAGSGGSVFGLVGVFGVGRSV